MMPICPVCGGLLKEEPHTWVCENKHCFDIARQGYVNLLPASKKHSMHPGDTKEMVAARKTFLDAGYYLPIAEKLCELLKEFCPGAETVLDAGCGEGYYLSQVEKAFPDAELWGVDISKDAVRYAAVRNKRAHWLTATAADLPFEDKSFDALLSMFSLTAEGEYARVLRRKGVYIQVLAGEEHLMGLKNIIYPEILRKEKYQARELDGFRLLHHEALSFPIELEDNAQVINLLSMTPHFWRISRDGAERLEKTERLSDRAEVVFNVYECV